MVNDVFDLEVDKISNPNRSIPSGKLSVREVLFAAVLSVIGSWALVLVLRVLIGTLIIAACTVIAFAYSVPPLRLRRFPLAPYLTIGTSAPLAFLSGASVSAGRVSNIYRSVRF